MVKFHVDHGSFLIPYERAPDEAEEIYLTAGREVKGSNARAEEAQQAMADLAALRDRIADLIENGGFDKLPRLRNFRLRAIGYYHYLEKGVWRALFLISPDKSVVIATVFSRKPHNYMSRLNELSARHQTRLSGEPVEDGRQAPTSKKEGH